MWVAVLNCFARKLKKERPRSRAEDNIKMDLKELGLDSVDGIRLDNGRDKMERLCERKNEAWCCIKSRKFRDQLRGR